MAIGLIIGVDHEPRQEELDLLIDRGEVPQEGLELVGLQLTADEAARRDGLRELFRAACVQRGWLAGLVGVNDLRIADLVVHGRRLIVVTPKAATSRDASQIPGQAASDTGAGAAEVASPADPSTGIPASPAERVRRLLADAGPTSLHGCTRILAVVVMHERPVTTADPQDSGAAAFGLTPQRIAHGLVEDYKRPGWVPGNLAVTESTAIRILHRPDTADLATGEANAMLAAELTALTRDTNTRTWSAISFAGEGGPFGHMRLAVLATRDVRGPETTGRSAQVSKSSQDAESRPHGLRRLLGRRR